MPRIFDNIDLFLLPELQEAAKIAYRGDFCVGYFNLRGWNGIAEYVNAWKGQENCARLLVGMQTLPQDELKTLYSFSNADDELDGPKKAQLKKRLVEDFREQLTIGAPTDQDQFGLQRLASQLRAKKLRVKLFVRHPLHAKLYLFFRQDRFNPIMGYVGSSNLTLAGMSKHGELNVDVLDQDPSNKLSDWFNARWEDDFGTLDITEELIQVIEESWARTELIPPYYIYLKMAFHLSQEARFGLTDFRIPPGFTKLLPFQSAAVRIAAHHINKRGGALIGDVVGFGKTLVGTAIAALFDDVGFDTLIICPKNLVKMWDDYRETYRLRARVLSLSRVLQDLPDLRRYKLVIIDESHNLRNREGKKYKAILDYIQKNESKVVLLTATPYNKSYSDLSNQLRLFLPEDQNLSIRPEHLIREIGEIEFSRQHQAGIHTLAAFEKSSYAEDWQSLLRLYMVRRSRSFIKANYAKTDQQGRKYLEFEDGEKSYFPDRVPRTIKFDLSADDQYGRLYDQRVVEAISQLKLPRYGLGQERYVKPGAEIRGKEGQILANLSRAGKKLIGFSRTTLFKRLESSGHAFLLSIKRHLLRNHVFMYALENGLPLPIGAQDPTFLDTRFEDEDKDGDFGDLLDSDRVITEQEEFEQTETSLDQREFSAAQFAVEGKLIYEQYKTKFQNRFDWITAELFSKELASDLKSDSDVLLGILTSGGSWQPEKDKKLGEVYKLLADLYPNEKVLIFTQFADTVQYLEENLRKMGIDSIAGVTGNSNDPTELAWRFSPKSNGKERTFNDKDELRVLVATDVLSEGQNLQDSAIVVNYDLPWAIIRLIQRVGRVDRIGQKAPNIFAYTFLPADGVELVIGLRDRLRNRLQQNAEVVGSDEVFFEDDESRQILVDLYNEKAGILEGEENDTEVDLTSYAYQIWKNAIDANPNLEKVIPSLANVIFSTKKINNEAGGDEGALIYVRTSEGNDSLAWINDHGENVTQSHYEILKAAECGPETPPVERKANHHELVRSGVEKIGVEELTSGGQLGRPSGARFKTYEILKGFIEENQGTLFVTPDLIKAVDEIYKFPMRESARDTLNRQLRAKMQPQQLAELVVSLRADDRLSVKDELGEQQDPKIICSMGLVKNAIN